MTNLVLSGVDYIKIVVTQQFKIQKLKLLYLIGHIYLNVLKFKNILFGFKKKLQGCLSTWKHRV